MTIHEIKHPLVRHKIGLLRRYDISTKSFRDLASEPGMLLTHEATQVLATKPKLPADSDQMQQMKTGQGMALLREGKRLVGYIAGARVPMPLSTERYIEKCRQYQAPSITVKKINQA